MCVGVCVLDLAPSDALLGKSSPKLGCVSWLGNLMRCKVMVSVAELAKEVRKKQDHIFVKMKKLQCTNKKPHCPAGITPLGPLVAKQCQLCGRARHKVRWAYASDNSGLRSTKGGTCAACVKTARILRCSRSPGVIKDSGGLSHFLRVSHRVQEELGKKDVCTCKGCKS